MFGQGFPFSGFGGAGNQDSDDDDGKNLFNFRQRKFKSYRVLLNSRSQ